MLCVQISDVTDKILPRIEDWKNRPLDEVYPILYIDAIHYSVRDNGVIRKLAAYPMRRKTPCCGECQMEEVYRKRRRIIRKI